MSAIHCNVLSIQAQLHRKDGQNIRKQFIYYCYLFDTPQREYNDMKYIKNIA